MESGEMMNKGCKVVLDIICTFMGWHFYESMSFRAYTSSNIIIDQLYSWLFSLLLNEGCSNIAVLYGFASKGKWCLLCPFYRLFIRVIWYKSKKRVK
jgi:hypothetical protein